MGKGHFDGPSGRKPERQNRHHRSQNCSALLARRRVKPCYGFTRGIRGIPSTMSHPLPPAADANRPSPGQFSENQDRFVKRSRRDVLEAVGAASRRTMNAMTGLGSDGGFASFVGRVSPSSRCHLSPIPITACWLALRRCGDVLSSAVLGKKLRSR